MELQSYDPLLKDLSHSVAGVWAGALKYLIHKFLLYVIVGKTIKVTGIALAGYYGATWLLGSS